MSSPVNIMVLCNNEMAIPAMQQLYMAGSLKAVVVPEKNSSLFSLLTQMLNGTGITPVAVNKKNLEAKIQSVAVEKNITTAWIMTFSYIIPRSLQGLLPGGFLNFHYGLLPQYRGVNPVFSQMINGETESGITVHVVDENIDTGPIIMQHKIPIAEDDTFGMQIQKLSVLGASMAINLLQICRLNPVPPSVPQNESLARYFKKPVAADLMINWNSMSSTQIIRLINACNPWNKGAGAMINNMGIWLTHAETVDVINNAPAKPGTIINLDKKNGLIVYCVDSKAIKINIACTREGYFPGEKLADLGFKLNNIFYG